MFSEIWKDIPGYERLYQASDLGRVRNNRGKIISQKVCRNRGGYKQVGLTKDGVRKYYRVHRLVWSAFNGPIPEGYEINHNDENPENNCLDNLSLMTRTENINWGTGKAKRGKAHRKMVVQSTTSGQDVCVWFSVKGIEEELGYNRGFIANCCRNLPSFKTAYGFIWRFV